MVDLHYPFSHFQHFKLVNILVYVNVVWESDSFAVDGEIWRHKNKHFFKDGVIDHPWFN